MDGDSNDGTTTESLNGETKPDAAKLAQTAIIKQDVMLSATSTQSPLATASSVFTMPTISMPTVSMANNTGLGGLADHLFLPHIPSVTDTPSSNSHGDGKADGGITSLSSPTQLFGQPQVAAPQFFLTGQSVQAAAASAAGQCHSPASSIQQLLIPVSTGNGAQQFISIPVSLAAGGNQQIQLLTTSNGQIIATNLANIPGLTQPLNLNINNTGAHQTQNSTNNSSQSHQQASGLGLANQLGSLPQLLTTGAQGQILAVGPQVINPLSLTQPTLASSANSSLTQVSQTNGQLTANHSTTSTHHTAIRHAHTNSQPTVAPVVSSPPRLPTQVLTPTVTSDVLPPNVSQLLPINLSDTVGNSTESTTVDGINLDEIKEFAKQFKIRRLSLGLTQTQVGQALSATEGPAYSQSAICRFEKLDITPKSAQKIKPVLERWMLEAEERYKNGVSNLTDFIGSEPSKKRKRRTSFTPQALEVLNQFFERNTHPSGAEMTELSEKLNYDREVIRVWFCNKRQALKNTIKKLKQETP
ncbi:POU domain, class 6, transcription factor 1-like isoform X1 [Pecten maximus]|uniref:POU domain, class 6, transcription factor 1-like isoform X1 n=1 Tax=Pecten maximus TaxID=6579 RepID=UPI0014580F2A|nr:POU domain, class 6, transcription factor 1-like isoform X1 [Pecten maximus]XP_033761345.1 POU domain, class 6, transcription factor 1-like isoform X1 [Pecten maximus]XP_033761346.1 POU domain, class 6, transcription factor 1-like isoform X1 [Pecten maximus]